MAAQPPRSANKENVCSSDSECAPSSSDSDTELATAPPYSSAVAAPASGRAKYAKLPEGWTTHTDPGGNAYYFNEVPRACAVP